MAAENESDSVSEPVEGSDDAEAKPRRRTRRSKAAAEEEAAPQAAPDEAVAEEKPKRRTRRRKVDAEPSPESFEAEAEAEEAPAKPKRRSRRKKADEAETVSADEPIAQDVAGEAEAEEAPAKPKRRSRRKKADADEDATVEAAEAVETDAGDEEEKKPAKRARRSRSKKAEEPEIAAENGDDDAEDVGAADALEEVPARKPKRRHYKIQEVVKRRQIMLVQVVKEERGNKGAALTTYLSLAGRYSVLMPNTARGGGISRKITSATDRKKLKEIASSLEVSEGMGVILRTAGADRTRSEIKRDFEYLLRLWENVRTLTLKSTAPCLVYEEGSLIKRSIRDLFDKDTKEIWVSGREGYEEARGFMEMLEPEQVKAVRYYDERAPLFAKMGVESQLDSMLQPQVTLKSGGYLVINQTEALVAIDENSGKSTRQHSIEETAYQTNLEAADEVARQLRLRDLAGLIVIDFIDMDDRRNNRSVEKRMKEALKNDRARIQVGRISHFGLMEMSRQRMRASVIESATETCPTCAGLGYVRSPSSVSIHVLRGIEEHLLRSAKHDITVRTRVQTALHMLNHKRSSIDDLEARFGVRITIEADESIAQAHFAIERGEPATARQSADRHVQVDSIRFEESDDEAPVAEEPVDAVETEEEQPKRRRRGRRGGRKSKANDEAIAQEASSEQTSRADEPLEDQAEPSGEDAVAAEVEAEKPRRRRRRAKSEDESAEASEEKVPATSSADSEDEGTGTARPKRRATSRPRRKKAEEAVADTAVQATSDAIMEGEVGQPIEDESAKATSEDEPARPKRRRTSRVRNGAADTAAESSSGEESSSDTDQPEKRSWLKRTFFPE